jgi:hypothetical protein
LEALTKRRPHNRLGWSVQWGTVRMLGTFLPEPSRVPPGVAAFVADQLEIDDPRALLPEPSAVPSRPTIYNRCGDGYGDP